MSVQDSQEWRRAHTKDIRGKGHRSKTYYTIKLVNGEEFNSPNHNCELKSGKRDDIIDYLVNTHLIEWYVCKLLGCSNLREIISGRNELAREYIQEIWVQILSISQEKWDKLYEQGKLSITAYCSGLIHHNCVSTTSGAYNKIQKYYNRNLFFQSDEMDNSYDDNDERLTADYIDINNNSQNEEVWQEIENQSLI